MRGTVESDCGCIHMIWIIKVTYFDIYRTFVRFTLTISDREAGLSDCVYDQIIVLLYFCSDITVLLFTEERGKPMTRRYFCITYPTIILIMSLSLMFSL